MARWWGKNLKIDGTWLSEADGNYTRMVSRSALEWEVLVQDVCRTIETKTAPGTGKANKTGALLMRLILAMSGKTITIVPIAAAAMERTQVKPVDMTKAMKKGDRFTCTENQYCSGEPSHGVSITPHSSLMKTGVGGGVNVRVFYHPAAWSSHDQVRGFDTMLDNIQPDDVLFHELFHAYRCMKGIFEEIPTGDTWDFTEEQMAIIATNVSVSEIGRGTSLRGDHNLTFHSLKDNKPSWAAGDQTVGSNFYRENMSIVNRMADEMPEFTGPLEKNDAASHVADWNPFRERIEFEKFRANSYTMGSVHLDMIVDGH
ncbi:MAG: hypothetical protein NTX48_16645 [Planctomycetales bacterium]|nr:hypothetical protein [Planctomycetales bacterium]